MTEDLVAKYCPDCPDSLSARVHGSFIKSLAHIAFEIDLFYVICDDLPRGDLTLFSAEDNRF